MNFDSIENLIVESQLPIDVNNISRDDVRRWVVHEKVIENRRTIVRGLMSVTALAFILVGWWAVLNAEVGRIHLLVGDSPSRSLAEFADLTSELCDAKPADHFVRQLSPDRRAISTSLASNWR
ncbi:MAG: hypothetical protein AB8B55_21640 [Mariniblastus sp.]